MPLIKHPNGGLTIIEEQGPIEWLEEHIQGGIHKAVERRPMPYPNEHACRLKQPGNFEDNSFRRMTRKHGEKAYSVIMGKLRGQDSMTEQAYRYDKDAWEEAEARAHCKDHGGGFSAAMGEVEKAGLIETVVNAVKSAFGVTEPEEKEEVAPIVIKARELSALYAVTPKKLEGLTDEHLQMVHDRVVVLKGSPTVNDVHIEGYGEFDDAALERVYKAVLAELKRRGFDVGEVEKGGTGSGNFGHAGIPGQVGGSAAGGGVAMGGGDSGSIVSGDIRGNSADALKNRAETFNRAFARSSVAQGVGALAEVIDGRMIEYSKLRQSATGNHRIRMRYQEALGLLHGADMRAIHFAMGLMKAEGDSLSREATFIQKDAKRQIVYGVVYEPNTVDIQKDWASAEEIEQACHKFMKAYRKMGIRHDGAVRDTIAPVESYIAPCDFQLGEQAVKKGSWVLAAHVESADTWKDVEENRLTGFSLFGKAKRKRGSVPA